MLPLKSDLGLLQKVCAGGDQGESNPWLQEAWTRGTAFARGSPQGQQPFSFTSSEVQFNLGAKRED